MTLPAYEIPEQDADLWECGKNETGYRDRRLLNELFIRRPNQSRIIQLLLLGTHTIEGLSEEVGLDFDGVMRELTFLSHPHRDIVRVLGTASHRTWWTARLAPRWRATLHLYLSVAACYERKGLADEMISQEVVQRSKEHPEQDKPVSAAARQLERDYKRYVASLPPRPL
jgi:hypothetical protein